MHFFAQPSKLVVMTISSTTDSVLSPHAACHFQINTLFRALDALTLLFPNLDAETANRAVDHIVADFTTITPLIIVYVQFLCIRRI